MNPLGKHPLTIFLETILREAEEEIGVDPKAVAVIDPPTPRYVSIINFAAYPCRHMRGGGA